MEDGDCWSASANAGVIWGPSGARGSREGSIREANDARRAVVVEFIDDELADTMDARRASWWWPNA